MGSSGEANAREIDASVGGLVWVRRRNGSWWPGRILGPEELPDSSLVSPRSGTPVKLLGREDASVDWYNLEKSKRVKAFRCGEYNECIEKAKASAASASKKAVKYARREDAILHALELESARLGKDHPDYFSRVERLDNEIDAIEGSPSSSHLGETEDSDELFSSSEDNSDSGQDLSQSGVSFEEPNLLDACKEQSLQERRWRTPNDSEDDGSEGIKRMKGLDDLGMVVASSFKRKRSQVAHVQEFLKKKNRRRPLTKVLESTAMVSVPIVCEQLPASTGSPFGALDSKNSGSESHGFKRSASMKEHETSSMLGLPENGSPEKLFDVPFVSEELHSSGLSPIISCASQKIQAGAGGQSSQSSQVETVSLGNEELNESGSTSSGTVDVHSISPRIEKGTSKWQLKGKRNSRHTIKIRKQGLVKLMDMDDDSDTLLAGLDQQVVSLDSGQKVNDNPTGASHSSESCKYNLTSRPVTEHPTDDFRGWGRNISNRGPNIRDPSSEQLAPQRLLPYRQSRFVMNPKYDSSDFSLRHHIAESSLYDVNVEVKASYRPQHVPYISLISKLNGQPITGHPVTVQVLEDGFCDNLLVSASESYKSNCESDDVTRKSISALQDVNMIGEARNNQDGKILTKRLAVQTRNSPTKSSKTRKNGLLSKKIRKLSSLTGSQKKTDGDKKPVVEKLKGPSVPCVPLKVVFSRINAALNGLSRPAHRLAAPVGS